MDCTNIDGANGNEAPGWRNAPDLLTEIKWVLYGAGVVPEMCDSVAEQVTDVLRERGLITLQGLELLQRDGDLTPL